MSAPAPQFTKFVTVAIPVLNERAYVAACLESLLPQLDSAQCEVLVLDGGSTDGTQAIVHSIALRHPFVRLVDNPKRLQSAACNLAADIADPRAQILLRADAHAFYPADFVTTCLAALESSGATSVVVPMTTVGKAGFQRAVAAAQNSKLGNGGSAHRAGGLSGFVDHGHHAVFDLAFFRRIGGYNEIFSHNEDFEFDHRANLAGGRVWMCREAAISYFPRKTPQALARQYAKHGAGRARTLLLHRLRPRPRQMLPVVVLCIIIASLLFSWLTPLALIVPALYILPCLIWGLVAAIRARDPWLLAMGPAAIIIHLAWAVGFLRHCVTQPASRSPAMREAF